MIDKELYTPMMRQYLEIKENNLDVLIFFRLGDFYELFFEDAKLVSKELDLYLTGRDAGAKEKVPMCGVPYHSVSGYIQKLVEKGYKVGIVEQLEEAGATKGIVKRGIVQMISPGALIDIGLKDDQNNYIASLDDNFVDYTLSYIDISTGEINVISIDKDIYNLASEIDALNIKELVVSSQFDLSSIIEVSKPRGIIFSYEDQTSVTNDIKKLVTNIIDARQIITIYRLINYLIKSQKRALTHLRIANSVSEKDYVLLDNFTRTNLELVRTVRSEEKFGSLLYILDKTKTAIGARLLRKWIIRPLRDITKINYRLDIVETFIANYLIREQLNISIKDIYDLERIISRVNFNQSNARDLLQLKKSIYAAEEILQIINKSDNSVLKNLIVNVDSLKELADIIESAIIENPKITIKEGGMFKEGYNQELDELKQFSSGGKQWLNELEIREREKTGVKNLKVGYNRVFGFYIEVTKSYLDLIKPEHGYVRKQTLANCERFISQELKEKEEQILHAEEKILKLEYELFLSLKDIAKSQTEKIQRLSDSLANIDVLLSFANVSTNNRYTRPKFNDQHLIEILEGRHPVVEKLISDNNYVSNDLNMDSDQNILIITGPNMGGKSTYMRQQALIFIMAQCGCYVPARSANIPIFNKIFTRIGASDDTISGHSTFMLEMLESNNALRNSDVDSLIIFDEIGRGTATFDGMAIAQAIIEYITIYLKAKTLFSTHYHQLTHLQEKLPGIKNVHVKVDSKEHQIAFLYKVEPGAVSKSYGINVARLANLPSNVVSRADEILKTLEKTQGNQAVEYQIIEKIQENPMVKRIKELDLTKVSPFDALKILLQLQEEVKE